MLLVLFFVFVFIFIASLQEKQEQDMLTEIQPPQAEQISAVSAALEAVVRDHGMTDEDVERRQSVVSAMQDLLLSVLPG